jgi:hypothetical protein
VGTDSSRQIVELSSPFEYTVSVRDVVVGNSFRIVDDGCTGSVLPVNGQCTFGVMFTPLEIGPARGIVTVSMSHICTSDQYFPCNWVPPPPGISIIKNFERVELPNGQVEISWQTALRSDFVGEGVLATGFHVSPTD